MNTFRRNEHLKHRKKILEIFSNGKSFNEFPVQVVYRIGYNSRPTEVQAGFSVPKKFFKHAVDRNHMKRLMRECYRLQKSEVIQCAIEKETSLYMMFIFKSAIKIDYQTLEQKIFLLLERLRDKVVNV